MPDLIGHKSGNQFSLPGSIGHGAWLVGAMTAIALSSSPMPAAATDKNVLDLPSGLKATLQEMLWDRPGGGLVFRFRFVADAFDPDVGAGLIAQDLEFLCNSFAVPRLASTGPQPSQIVISLADKPSQFGIYDSEVKQVFETYSIEGETCIWEIF